MKGKIRSLLSKFSYTQLAAKFGVTEVTIRRWLKDTEPHPMFRKKINRLYAKCFKGSDSNGRLL